jgi:hypothetical protein
MLAPLILDSLMVALLFLLIGWASDAFRASMHGGPGGRTAEGFPGSLQSSRGFDPAPAGTYRHSGLRTLGTGEKACLGAASSWS